MILAKPITNEPRSTVAHMILTYLPYWIFADRHILKVLEMIDGSLQEVIFSNKDLSDIFNFLTKNNLIEDSKDKIDVEEKYVLQYITLNITNSCNLFCKHCYIDAGINGKMNMSIQEAMLVVNKLKKITADTCNIIVSGGEAFQNLDCISILKYISMNTNWKITVVSNGTLITDEIALELSKIKKLSVQISLDGAKKETHEFLRGKNTFDKTIAAIERLKKYDIEAVFLQPINNVGRARDNKLVRVDDSIIFEKVLKYLLHSGENIKIGTLESKYISNIRLLDKCDYCGTGSATLAIQPDGNIYPCPNMILPEMKIGNIFLDEIVKLWIESPILNELRKLNVNINLDEKCRECEVKHFCGGGCRGVAYQNTGKLNALSINCEYEKKQRIAMLWAIAENPELCQNECERQMKLSEKRLMEIDEAYSSIIREYEKENQRLY